jgi:hypothetical protein
MTMESDENISRSSARSLSSSAAPEIIDVTPLLWGKCQVFAKQAGWHPAGAMHTIERSLHSTYGPGRAVRRRDAMAFAAALERVINGETADSGEFGLGAWRPWGISCGAGPFLIR